MKQSIFLTIQAGYACLFALACTTDHGSQLSNSSTVAIGSALQRLLDESVASDPNVRGALLGVTSRRHGLNWLGASGYANPEISRTMSSADPFRICSVTKPMTASVILKLTESPPPGKKPIKVTDKISQYLPREVMHRLHVLDGVEYSQEITIDQLGRHLSGLTSAIDDPEFMRVIFSDPGRIWSPTESINYVKGHISPAARPGERWIYSDTGYMLLGMIIEEYTGLSLQEAYRRYVYIPAGMRWTWMEFLEDPPVGLSALSHVYYGGTDYTEMKATTAGWGASGLASTLSDLNDFMQALVEKRLFSSPETWKTMTTWVPATGNIPNLEYGFGLFHVTGDYGEIIGHTGACKSVLNYWVDEGVTITATLNQWTGHSKALVKGVLDILIKEL